MSSVRRFARPCSGCRSRRIACFPGAEVPGPCHRCESKGVKCDVPDTALTSGSERDENELAEMRAQITRLDNMLQILTGGASPESSPSPSPSSSSMGSDMVEINDLIGAMTNLCFATEGLDGPISLSDDMVLVKEASKVLALPKVDELHSGGFVFHTDRGPDSVEAVIKELPDWEECSKLLHLYSTRWFSMNDSLFTPYWYDSVKELYASEFRSLRTPCQLAELFGVLAITKSGQAVEQGECPLASKFASVEAENYSGMIRRALELANFWEEPCLESVRALHLISTLHLLWATSTTHFSCGFAIIPCALTMAMQVGLHHADIGRYEEPWELYERKAVITGLFRNDWTYPPSYGRPSSTNPDMIALEPPEALRDEDLLPHMRNSSWRAPKKTIQGIRARFLFAKLHREMSIDLFASSKQCDYSAVQHYAERLRYLEDKEIPLEWRRVDDAVAGRLHWAVPSHLSTPEDVIARLYAVPKLCKVGMALHRPFIGPRRQDGIVDEAWHRKELIRWARMSFTTLPEAKMFTNGPFVSITCSVFDTLVGLCLVIKTCPDEPLIEKYREELTHCIRQVQHSNAPAAISKLVRITTSLLEKAPARDTDVDAANKRARAGVALDKNPRLPSLSPDSSQSQDTPNSFEFSVPVTPQLNAPEEPLPHKRPVSDADFDRLAPFYNSRTFNQLSNASSGLDVLSVVALSS